MNMWLKVWGLVVFTIILSGAVFAGDDDGEKWGKVTEEQWNLSAPSKCPDAAAVVIFDNGSLEVPPPYQGNYVEFKRHLRIKVLNKTGAAKAAEMEIEGSDLRGFGAHTILRDGRKLEVAGKDRFVKKVGDEEITTFTFPALEDGCVIECKYSTLAESFGFLPPWNFQSELFTLKSQLKLTLWGGFDYSVQLSNVAESLRTPTRKQLTLERMGPVEFTWTLRDLAPVEEEPYMAAVSNYLAKVTCQLNSYRDLDNTLNFAKDWKSLGDRFLTYYQMFVDSKGDLEKTAASLTDGITASTDKVKRLYQYARDEILTQGGEQRSWFEKDKLGQVLKERSGNGAEKNALLVEMLKAVGVEASPLLIGTRDYAAFDPNVFMLRQFNHLICHVSADGQTYLLDAGNRGVPFPYLPPHDVTSGGLLLKKKASEVIPFQHSNRKSTYETFSKLRAHADGSATCTTHVSLRGYQIHAKRELLQDKPPKDVLNELLLNDDTYQYEVASYSYSKEIDSDSATVDVVLSFPSLCLAADQQLVCSLPFSLWTESPFSKPKRYFPIDFTYPRTYMHVLDLECDDGMTVVAVPQSANEAMDGVNFSQTALTAGKSARVMTQFIISKPVFPPGMYDELRALFDKVSSASAEPVTITL